MTLKCYYSALFSATYVFGMSTNTSYPENVRTIIYFLLMHKLEQECLPTMSSLQCVSLQGLNSKNMISFSVDPTCGLPHAAVTRQERCESQGQGRKSSHICTKNIHSLCGVGEHWPRRDHCHRTNQSHTRVMTKRPTGIVGPQSLEPPGDSWVLCLLWVPLLSTGSVHGKRHHGWNRQARNDVKAHMWFEAKCPPWTLSSPEPGRWLAGGLRVIQGSCSGGLISWEPSEELLSWSAEMIHLSGHASGSFSWNPQVQVLKLLRISLTPMQGR